MALTTVVFLPIQAAALRQQDRNCVSFIPLLAEEGHKLNVGGEGQRGGLLAYYTDGLNLLQILACLSPWYYNSFCLHLLKRLRQSQLLKKEDFREYDLLFRSCKPEAEEWFKYLVDWDPEALKDIQGRRSIPSYHRRLLVEYWFHYFGAQGWTRVLCRRARFPIPKERSW